MSFRIVQAALQALGRIRTKSSLHNCIEDLRAFTPEANARTEERLQAYINSRIPSTESVNEEQLASLAQECISTFADQLLKHLVDEHSSCLRDQRTDISGFRKRLNQRWGVPLDLFELLIALSTDAGANFNANSRPDASRKNNITFDVLTRLHARACQVASEVLVLLRHGFADGAHARWRSIHEISVVSYLIHKHGDCLAERYLLHDTVQRFKLARAHQDHYARIGDDPVPAEDIARLKAERDELVDRFGKSYGGDYGWAADAIGRSWPTIRDLEAHAGIDHMIPYYRMASDNVHANVHGSLYRLGLGLDQLGGEVLLAGPSDMGLADPGHSTAISLGQVTMSLVGIQQGLSSALIANVILKLQDRIGDEFLKVHRERELPLGISETGVGRS